MNQIHRFKRLSLSGFTLIEIMISLAVYGSIFGVLVYLITSALHTRDLTSKYNQTIFLAKQKMDSIRDIRESKEEEDTFEAFPDYTYYYRVREEEIDLLALADQTGLLGALTNNQREELQAKIDQLTASGQRKESVTGGIFKLMHYFVRVSYRDQLNYTLNFYQKLN